MKRSKGGKPKGGKQASEEVTGEEARSLKTMIDTTGTLSDPDVLRVLKANIPCEGLYSKACKGKSGNPTCLCNLLPTPEGFRRQGLWAKEADVLGTLGPDPAATQRKDSSKPVGLKNLGNTCYVNSVLQCLFANIAFRRAVYALKQPLADEPIIKELRQLFLAMEHGCSDPVDPEPLAKSLNLDHGVQQDGQEFMKLFLSLLEAKFGQQADLQGVIQALFRGQSGYLTVCQSCQQASESSSRSDNFYEVDVPVKGFRSLQDSLNSMLMPETMEGDNQYSCERCNKKVDATRQLELRSLPPMLCFSLQRFVFDFNRMDRVKVSDKFAFPLTLDLAPIICRPPSPELVYELEAIMVHKGGSATQGHYVAHIKLEGRPASSGKEDGGGKEEGAAPAPAPAPASKQPKKGGGKKTGGGKTGGKAAAAAAADKADEAEVAEVAVGAVDAGDGGGSSWWRFDDDSVTELNGGPTSSTDHGGAAGKAAAAAAADGSVKKKGARGGVRAGGGHGVRGWRGGKGGRSSKKGRDKKAAGSSSDDEQADAKSEVEEEDPELAAAMAASLEDAPPGRAAVAAAAAAADQQQQLGASAQQVVAAGQVGQWQRRRQQQQEEIVSSNAYLLVYRRQAADLPMVPLDGEQAAALVAAQASLAEEQERAVAAYADAKHKLLERQKQRQGEVRGLVEAAAKLGEGDPGRFVSLEWLSKWADAGVEAGPPEPVDNSPLLCPHNSSKLDPTKVAAARRISTPAWEQLRRSYRGGPELAPGDTCPKCLATFLDNIVAKEDTQGLKEHYLTMAAMLLAGEGPEQDLEPAFYIGSQWLSAWLRQRKGSMGGTTPTKDITCACGQLAPEGSKSKRIAIPADFWRFLQRSWQAACAKRQAKELKRARKTAGSGAGAGGIDAWEVAEEQQQEEQQQALPEIINLESPITVVTEEQQQPAAGCGRLRWIRGRASSAAAAAAAAGEEVEVEEVGGLLLNGKGGKEEEEEEADLVMLDADSDGAAGGSGTAGGAAAAAAAVAAADMLLEFPVSCRECAACSGHLKEASNALKGLQGRLHEEKAGLAHLLQAGTQQALVVGETYRLVPAAFMAQWRSYMQQAGKRTLSPSSKAAQIVQPPSLVDAMLGVLCECHHGGGAKQEEGEEAEAGAPAGGSSGTAWMLGFAPPAVVSKRGRWTLADADGGCMGGGGGGAGDAASSLAAADAGVFEVLHQQDWYALSAYYGPDSEGGGGDVKKRWRQQQLDQQLEALLERGIEATLLVESGSSGDGDGKDQQPPQLPQSPPLPLQEAAGAAPTVWRASRGRVAALKAAGPSAAGEDSSSSGGAGSTEQTWVMGNDENPYKLNRRATPRQGAAGTAHFATNPPLCQQAVAERQARLRASLLNYANEEVVVELVATVEEAVAAGDVAAGAERKSKRARKGRAYVAVGSGSTLRQLRLHVLQSLDVHPMNAQLFLRGVPLMQGDDATLAECEVYPSDEIKVVDSGEHDGSDLASLFPSCIGRGKRPREAELGFTGTALTGLALAGAGSTEEGAGCEAPGQSSIDMDAKLVAVAATEEVGDEMAG